jgi:hypothetical protein
VLEPPGDLDLEYESLSNLRVVGEPLLKLFHGNMPVKLAIECNAHAADTAVGVVVQHAKPPILRARRRRGPVHLDSRREIIDCGRLDLHIDFGRQRVRRAGELPIEQLDEVREPAAVFFPIGRQTVPGSELSFDPEQLFEEPQASRSGSSVEIILDPRRFAGKPGVLESIGDRVD